MVSATMLWPGGVVAKRLLGFRMLETFNLTVALLVMYVTVLYQIGMSLGPTNGDTAGRKLSTLVVSV